MYRKTDNNGLSLVELIVAIAIMAILVGVIAPQMVKYIGRARQVKVEKEASEFMRAAQIALVDVTAQGKAPESDSIKNKTESTSPYYKNGTKYGNITNYSVHDGFKSNAGYSNVSFGKEFFALLGITYGAEWKSGKSSISISANQPKKNPAGSLTKECIFQVFYDSVGNMVVEYSREGYFVRMENSLLVESMKIKDENEKHFTSWK
ncbi:MAG: type II secretion system protein [Lachnospiraceae bacterium]|nr:type II secretion system protein [Lachnospiraceae bacterium]